MLLSDRDIRWYASSGILGIEPFDAEMIQPSSIDVRLGRRFEVMKSPDAPAQYIDPAKDQRDELFKSTEIHRDGALGLAPGAFALATTYEIFRLPNTLAGRLEGKSSLGRLGLAIHTTAGFIDPGFEGQITLELVNLAPRPVMLQEGMKIGQLCLMHMSSPAQYPYGHPRNKSRYQGQRGPTASRSFQDSRHPRSSSAGTDDGYAGPG